VRHSPDSSPVPLHQIAHFFPSLNSSSTSTNFFQVSRSDFLQEESRFSLEQVRSRGRRIRSFCGQSWFFSVAIAPNEPLYFPTLLSRVPRVQSLSGDSVLCMKKRTLVQGKQIPLASRSRSLFRRFPYSLLELLELSEKDHLSPPLPLRPFCDVPFARTVVLRSVRSRLSPRYCARRRVGICLMCASHVMPPRSWTYSHWFSPFFLMTP